MHTSGSVRTHDISRSLNAQHAKKVNKRSREAFAFKRTATRCRRFESPSALMSEFAPQVSGYLRFKSANEKMKIVEETKGRLQRESGPASLCISPGVILDHEIGQKVKNWKDNLQDYRRQAAALLSTQRLPVSSLAICERGCSQLGDGMFVVGVKGP